MGETRAPTEGAAPERRSPRTCTGPIYFADQGIEVCSACGGCVCCDFADVDHAGAEYECFTDADGRCHLRAHAGRECTKRRSDQP